MIPAHWHTLEPLLDEALDAEAAARAELLARLRQTQPDLVGPLEALLQKHQQALDQKFLQHAAGPGLFSVPMAGQQLGAYTLESLLGEGGMGSVWLGRRHDGRYEGHVAIKLLSRGLASPMMADRFRREGQILARLNHPHIARLLDAGVSPNGQPYLVLEHVSGLRIDEYADAHNLGVDARLRLFLELLDAVALAHQQLVVHRDIKPSNVMVTDEGQVKLLDFGVAKLLEDDDAGSMGLTQQAGGLLSPGYAAPEQIRGEHALPAADVFALGVLLTLLLTGRHPFLRPGDTTADALRAGLERPIARLSATTPDPGAAVTRASTPQALRKRCKGDLDTLAAKALAREAEQRFANAGEFAQDLRRHLAHEPILAHPPSLSYRFAKFVQRQRVPLTVALMGLVAAAVLGANAWQQQQAAALSQAKAQSVDGLLASLFEGMNPAVAQTRRFEARELLQRGQGYLAQDTRLDEVTRREVLLRMAALYEQVGANDEALAIYAAEERAVLARQDQEPALMRALWHQADIALRTTRLNDARLLLDRLAPMVARHGADLPVMTGRTDILRGELADLSGDRALAAQAYERAGALLAAHTPQDAELMGRLETERAFLARASFDLAATQEHFERAKTWHEQRGDRGSMDVLELDVELGALEIWRGRPQAADIRLTRRVQELQHLLPENHDLVIGTRAQLAFARLRQGQFNWVRSELAELRRLASRSPAWLDFVLVLGARQDMYEGHAVMAEPVLRARLVDAERRGDIGATGAQTLRRLHAESLLRLGRLDEAGAEILLTQANLLKLATHDNISVASNNILLGCLQARRGQLKEAHQTWDAAHSVLQAQLGEAHPTTLAAASYLALAKHALTGRSRPNSGALALQLEQSMGWQDGATALARRLRQTAGPFIWATLPTVL